MVDHRRPRPVPGRLGHPARPLPGQPGGLRRPLPVAGRRRGDAPLAGLPARRRRPRPVAGRRRHRPGRPRHPAAAAPGHRLRRHPARPGPGDGRPRPRRRRSRWPRPAPPSGPAGCCSAPTPGPATCSPSSAPSSPWSSPRSSSATTARPTRPPSPSAGSRSGSGWTTPASTASRSWPGAALKAAQDVGGHQVTATTRGFDPDPAAAERLAGFLRTRLPAAAGTHDHSATCLYTLTPDRDFVLGPLPGHDRVLVALGAAHGFKFAPLLGRALADLALHDGTDVDIAPFAARPSRPHQPPARGQLPGLSGADGTPPTCEIVRQVDTFWQLVVGFLLTTVLGGLLGTYLQCAFLEAPERGPAP